MKVGYDHELLSSFYLWFNDRITYFGEAYVGPIEHNFVYVDSHDIPENYLAYYSPYRQFVAASDKFEQPVDNYVFIDGEQVFDKDGIYIDYDQGRVLLSREKFGNKQNLEVVGFFAVKTLNSYITDDTEEDVILNKDFIISPLEETYLQSTNGFGENMYTMPAAFLTLSNSYNKPFAFGGMDETCSGIRAVIVADSNYSLDGALSLLRDSAKTTFSMIPFEEFPFAEFSSIKNHPYKYTELSANRDEYCFIEEVRVSKLTDRSRERIAASKDYKIGFVDFEISNARWPRKDFQR
jgi:hypothetical protein